MIDGLGLFFLFIPGLGGSFGCLELGLDGRVGLADRPVGIDRPGRIELSLRYRNLIGQGLEFAAVHVMAHVGFQGDCRRRLDIDVDFEHERREEVIQYIFNRYGRRRAALAAVVSSYHAAGAIRARIDDKLSRIANAQTDDDEDAVTDLIGYLILLKTTQMEKQ